jgi:hypothetical protein
MKRGTEIDIDVEGASKLWTSCPEGPPTATSQYEFFSAQGVDVVPAGRGGSNEHQITESSFIQAVVTYRWAWHWADCGFTTLRASHTYAAALMSTDPLRHHEDLILPWRALRVEVPSGLLVTASGELDARWIYLCALDDDGVGEGAESLPPFVRLCSARTMLGYSTHKLLEHRDVSVRNEAKLRINFASDLAQLLWTEQDPGGNVEWINGVKVVESDEKERLMLLAKNYVTGLLYTLQHTQHWKASESRHGHRSTRDGRRSPPTHRNVFCGRPIAIDLRAVIREQLERSNRTPAPASVQSLVRGHYKRQVIGVGRSGRKVIWVEPYWRGPEEAPIVVRPYSFT